MSTITDIAVYESIETECKDDTRNCLKKMIIVQGQEGKQIKLTKFAIDLANKKSGILSTCTISVEINGVESKIASWSNSNTVYTSRSYEFSQMGEVGKDIIIRVYLKTANKSYKALARNFSYTYEYITIEEEEVVTEKAFLVVECCSQEEATELAGKIKEIAPSAVIGIVSKI